MNPTQAKGIPRMAAGRMPGAPVAEERWGSRLEQDSGRKEQSLQENVGTKDSKSDIGKR